MRFIATNKKPSLGEMIAVRLEQRCIPAIGKDSQVFVFESNKREAEVVLSLVPYPAFECWGGFWFWTNTSNKELLQFKMPSEYRYGVNDPLSVEIAFLEWVEENRCFCGAWSFIGSPHESELRELKKVRKHRRDF